MSKTIKVVVDAMGGDNAPEAPVKGAVEALNEVPGINIILAGRTEEIKKELDKYTYDNGRISIVHADDIIGFDEPPVMAIRKKKNSSIVVGMNLVKHGDADAFVSAGSTGAILVGGQFVVGRIKGVERSPLAPVIPTAKGPALLIDCGANVDARASHLVQFAKMGSIYMQHPLLKECTDINFTGSIEARDIPKGDADVIVCEAFVGNVILKLYEGLASTLIGKIKEGLMSSFQSKMGALLIKPALKKTLKQFDVSGQGGAPLLGLNGLVVKAHGSSGSLEIKQAIKQCIQFGEEKINEKIKENLTIV